MCWSTLLVVLCIFKTLFEIFGLFIAYVALKYFNQKPLGMQTIFDQMIKDKIYLSIMNCLCNFFMVDVILFFMKDVIPLNHIVAHFLTFILVTLALAELWQISMILIIRYVYVFYSYLLSNVDENFIKKATRVLVGFLALMSTLMTNLQNSHTYCILTDQSVKDNSNPAMIVKIICFFILIVTQYKIEMFSKYVASKRKFYQIEEGGATPSPDDQERNCKYNKINIRIILVILCVLFLVTYFLYENTEDLYIQRLKIIVVIVLINFNIIPMLYIATNENMYCLFKNQVMKIMSIRFVCLKRKCQLPSK